MQLIKILLTVVILGISIVGPYKAYLNYSPVNDLTINIEPGQTINSAISEFEDLDLIKKVYLKIYLNLNNINFIQSGEYKIDGLNIRDIISLMVKGDTLTHKIQIKEGSTIYDIQNLLENSFLENDCKHLECIDSRYSFVEGTLYPDTYFYKKGMKASQIIINSHQKLENYLNKEIDNSSFNNLLTRDEILILASIIEKEAGSDLEKIQIAGVFLKRLSINMRLQADPTIIYGLLPNFDGNIKKSDILDKNNKYNTYMINGLPPSPISISSLSSISAAARALPGEYLFFVADSPSSHHFSKTYDEHLNKINELGLNK